jgi:hypothetical protein
MGTKGLLCVDGLGVRVENSQPKGYCFESLLEQFLLKTKGVSSGPGNRNMIGRKIPSLGMGKRPEKILGWLESSLSVRKNISRCMEHLVLRHPSYRPGFTYPFCISVSQLLLEIHLNRPRLPMLLFTPTVAASLPLVYSSDSP